jgi:hypothetical protein
MRVEITKKPGSRGGGGGTTNMADKQVKEIRDIENEENEGLEEEFLGGKKNGENNSGARK